MKECRAVRLWYENIMIEGLSWPSRAWPVIMTAGRFLLADRDFATTYRGATHSIHLYDYEGVFRTGGRSLALRPGDLTCSPAGGSTQYHLPRPGRHWCVHFLPATGPDAVQIPQHIRLPGPLRQRVGETVLRIAGLRSRTGEHAAAGAPAGAGEPAAADSVEGIAASALLQGLLLELSLAAHEAPPAARRGRTVAVVARAEAAIEQQLAKPLDVAAIAAACGLTRPWLAKVFHATHGMTLHRWHLQRRIDHARVLLRTTALPMGEIATRLGFSDAQHLNKQFRRIAGCAPSAYRAWAAKRDA